MKTNFLFLYLVWDENKNWTRSYKISVEGFRIDTVSGNFQELLYVLFHSIISTVEKGVYQNVYLAFGLSIYMTSFMYM